MRNLIVVLCLLLGAVLHLAASRAEAREAPPVAGTPAALASSADPAGPALAGTGAEEREYLQREAASPETQDFTGGAVIIFFGVGFVVVVLFLVFVVFAAHHAHEHF